eukprot:m.27877 g.27877  ORF g.27877 m.27877 type:complete len:88 (+) comp30435_c0_seq1:174-437(+)
MAKGPKSDPKYPENIREYIVGTAGRRKWRVDCIYFVHNQCHPDVWSRMQSTHEQLVYQSREISSHPKCREKRKGRGIELSPSSSEKL